MGSTSSVQDYSDEVTQLSLHLELLHGRMKESGEDNPEDDCDIDQIYFYLNILHKKMKKSGKKIPESISNVNCLISQIHNESCINKVICAIQSIIETN